MSARNLLAIAASPFLLLACSSDAAVGESAKEPLPPERAFTYEPMLAQDCDPLAPDACGYPFPSNVYLKEDATSPTGKRVNLRPGQLPPWEPGKTMDVTAWADSDGFSKAQAPMVYLKGATADGLPTQENLEASLGASSPTVLFRADTGERVAHFAEKDVSLAGDADGPILIRPVVPLVEGVRYVVALRHVKGEGGADVAPSPAFMALRDGASSTEASVERRRELYDDMFTRLERVGVPRKDLQIAWDFTVASRANNTRTLLHLRDQALAEAGADGPEYTITSVKENPAPKVARRIEGKIKVPLWLDQPSPAGQFILDEQGFPKRNGTAEYPFIVQIPTSVMNGGAPAGLLQNGHGLLDVRSAGMTGWYTFLNELCDQERFVVFATDWIGLSEDDAPAVANVLFGDPKAFRGVVDRQQQGVVNALLAMRMMKGRFRNDPNVQVQGRPAYDPSQAFYRGDSQGGILGTTYMALSKDVTRGILGVPGMAYNLMLTRSSDFPPFFEILQGRYKTAPMVQLVLGLIQMHWDRVEASSYAAAVAREPFPDTPKHDVLLHVGINDQQVTHLAAHLLARSLGAKVLTPAVRPLFGLETTPSPATGSVMVEFDFTTAQPPSPAAPLTNGAPPDTDGAIKPPTGSTEDLPTTHPWTDPHRRVRNLPVTWRQTGLFFRDGTVTNTCDGACDPN